LLRSLQEIHLDFMEEGKAYAGLWSQGRKEGRKEGKKERKRERKKERKKEEGAKCT